MVLHTGKIVKVEKQVGKYTRNAQFRRTGVEATYNGYVLKGGNCCSCQIAYVVNGTTIISTFIVVNGEWRKERNERLAVVNG